MRYLLIASLLVLATPAPVAAVSPSPTPTVSPSPSPTAAPAPAPLPGEVRINEFLPNPVGTDTGNEWLELANVSGHDVAAGGLVVARLSGSNLVTVAAGTVIHDGDVLLLSQLSGSIVNSGDTILLKSGQTELDRVTYDAAGVEGQSWARFSATEGAWTFVPTPGEPNPAQVPDADPGSDDSGGSGAVAAAASTKASTSSTKTATAKKTTAKKLPTSGPSAGMYVTIGLLAMLYWYVRRSAS